MPEPPPVDEAAIRAHVAERVAGLGGQVAPDAISVSIRPDEAAPGIALFVATYDTPTGRSQLTGIASDGGPSTFPQMAVGQLFDRWLATGGLPDPARVAEVVTFVLSSGSSQFALLTDADVARLPKPEWRAVVKPPVAIEVKKQPGVEFWLDSQLGLVRKRVVAKDRGGVQVEDRLLADVLKGK